MAYNTTTYPSGFKVPVREGESATEANVQIRALHQIHSNSNPVITNWDFISEVLTLAKKLVPSFDELLEANLKNAGISPTAYDLLRETVHFINTGHRTISLPTHLSMLADEQFKADVPNNISARQKPKLECPNKTALLTWSLHQGGVSDILCTLNYIFGTNPHE